jgi:hypothetical protein
VLVEAFVQNAIAGLIEEQHLHSVE